MTKREWSGEDWSMERFNLFKLRRNDLKNVMEARSWTWRYRNHWQSGKLPCWRMKLTVVASGPSFSEILTLNFTSGKGWAVFPSNLHFMLLSGESWNLIACICWMRVRNECFDVDELFNRNELFNTNESFNSNELFNRNESFNSNQSFNTNESFNTNQL